MTEEQMRALMLLAGFNVEQVWKLQNGYWPDVESYAEVRRNSPWWLIKTQFGLVRMGWRKRVISIDWSATARVADVTKDDVTKEETMVHAYSHHKAVEYLSELRRQLQVSPAIPETTGAAS
ncbi:MAG: hypothetical protein EOO23_02775 [Comamonadaceae bacterium]|nr:MAG: hypothetical protein EOO23_02775 [Comamonadaceae bacterium]